jgi:hypothetical protein
VKEYATFYFYFNFAKIESFDLWALARTQNAFHLHFQKYLNFKVSDMAELEKKLDAPFH